MDTRLNASAGAIAATRTPKRLQPGHDVMGWKIGRKECVMIPLQFDHHARGLPASPISFVKTMWFETGHRSRAVTTAAIHRMICGE